MKESVQIQLEQNSKVVGIRFKSNGLHQFLKIPIKEITGQTIELTPILGNYYTEAAKATESSLSAVGLAWKKAWEIQPNIGFYSPDELHAF
jgi:hypothetical protein